MSQSSGIGSSAVDLARIRVAYEQFRDGRSAESDAVRSVVRDSWMRSLRGGVDPSASIVADMSDDVFADYRAGHPMTAVRPMVQSLMLDDIGDAGVVVALTDESGRLLWLEGDREAKDRAAAIDFVEGAMWSEEVVGTNAPGLALALGHGVQIVGAEHFAEPVQEWSCAAAPVHNPATGHVIGVLDITGGSQVAAPFAMSAVRSAVAAVELQIRYGEIDLGTSNVPAGVGVRVLDTDGYRFFGEGRVRRLTPRHAEILLLLSRNPHGLSAEELAVALSDGGVDGVTVRAEISRLRRDLGAHVLQSRPYRLEIPVVTDVDRVVGQIRRRDVIGAISTLGRGGLLAQSRAPGVIEVFDEVLSDIRSAVLAGADRAALAAWTDSVHGRDDRGAWQLLATLLQPEDPDRIRAQGRVRMLDQRFGTS